MHQHSEAAAKAKLEAQPNIPPRLGYNQKHSVKWKV